MNPPAQSACHFAAATLEFPSVRENKEYAFFFLLSFNRFSRKLKKYAPILLVSRNYVLTEFLEVWLSCGLALKKLLPPRVARNFSVPLKVSEI